MTYTRGSIVASQAKWDRVATALPPGLQGQFLKLLELIEEGGMENLPPSLARRIRDNLWEIRIVGPEGRYFLRIISEAHGDDLRPINRDDGRIGVPPDMKRQLLTNPDVHKEWVLADTEFRQSAALFVLPGLEDASWTIPPKGPEMKIV